MLVFRAHHYFAFSAPNTQFLGSESASIFFNSAFSRSNAFRRLASLTRVEGCGERRAKS